MRVKRGDPPDIIDVVAVHRQSLVRSAFAIVFDAPSGFVLLGVGGSLSDPSVAHVLQRADVLVLDGAQAPAYAELLRSGRGATPPALVIGEAKIRLDAHAAAAIRGAVDANASIEALRSATQAVASGGAWFDLAAIEREQDAETDPTDAVRVALLTQRETEVLDLVARGRSNKDIAGEIEVSIGTVKAHISRIFAKLGVSNRAGAIVFALRNGITDLRVPAPPP